MLRKDRQGNDVLWIFEQFLIDIELPKHKPEKIIDLGDEVDGVALDTFTTFINQPNWDLSLNGITGGSDYTMAFMERLAMGTGFFNGVAYFILIKLGFGKTKPRKSQPRIINKEKLNSKNVKLFFDSIKSAKAQLELHDNKLITAYEDALQLAYDGGQTALVETLKEKMGIVLMESTLVENNFGVYMKEEDIIKFFQETDSSKNLILLYVKNFIRVIPKEVIEIKKKADKLKIFDNYVVLAFDPLNQMGQMTKKEVEQSKDPILFGVIKGSRKLYYIADWEDEFCDLKLEDVLRSLGKEKDLLKDQDLTKNVK